MPDGEQGNSVINFGPFSEFESRRSLTYSVHESSEGGAERELLFVTEDSIGNRIYLRIQNAAAAAGTWQVADSGMTFLVASVGSDDARVVEGTVTIAAMDSGRALVTFSSIGVIYGNGEGQQTGAGKLDDGWIESNVDRTCLYLAPNPSGITVDGEPLLEPTLDPAATSEFCAKELVVNE